MDGKIRRKNAEILSNVDHKFYGANERTSWLKGIYGKDFKYIKDVIPSKCHAETSFGLLYALYHDYDRIFFIDDDTAPTTDDYFTLHLNQIKDRIQYREIISDRRPWHNLMSSYFSMPQIYPRGYPYYQRIMEESLDYPQRRVNVVMNQGLWVGQPDLNASDILPYTNGMSTQIEGTSSTFASQNIVLNKGNFTTICSMNLSFRSEIIPAFYQLPMNEWGIDRFDDIWSGVIIKYIADHLDKSISHGVPLVNHYKTPRSTFKDLKVESAGLEINETFWEFISEIELEGKTWRDCYYEIGEELYNSTDYYRFLGNKMKLWTFMVDVVE